MSEQCKNGGCTNDRPVIFESGEGDEKFVILGIECHDCLRREAVEKLNRDEPMPA